MAPVRRSRRSCKSVNDEPEDVMEATPEPVLVQTETMAGKRRGRKRKRVIQADKPDADEALPQPAAPAQGKKRGRKPKQQHTEQQTATARPKRKYTRRAKPKLLLDDDEEDKNVPNPAITYTEEELQEMRVNEELQRLSNVNEVLRLSHVRDRGSDAESGDDDNNAFMDGSDDDVDLDPADLEDIMLKEDEQGCPRPAPRKGRAGTKYAKRNLDLEVSQEEVRDMCLFLTSTLRRSLTSNAPVQNQSVGIKTEVNDTENQVAVVHSVPWNKSLPIVYGRLGHLLRVQEEWMLASNGMAMKDEFTTKLCKYHLRNGLAKQLYIEHLCWISTLCIDQPEQRWTIHENGVLAWLPAFQMKYGERYPALNGDASPYSQSELDKVLKMDTVKTTGKIGNSLQHMIGARSALQQLTILIENVFYDKHLICNEFEKVYDMLKSRHAKYDESSMWGLKPIRLALEPPYFKTGDAYMAMPMTHDAMERGQKFSMCFFKRDKQKWTTKDLDQLKVCIEETLRSKKLSSLRDRYEMLMADCIRRYDEEIAKEGRYDAPPLNPLKKKPGRPRNAEREMKDKYSKIYPVVAVLPNGIVIRSEVTPKILSDWRFDEERKLRSKSYQDLIFMENEIIDWTAVANKMVLRSRKNRTMEDCELAWRHEVHPRVNDKRWGVEESNRLKDIWQRSGNDWDWYEMAKELNIQTTAARKPGRTPYQCFFRIRNRISPPKKITWNKEMDNQVLCKLGEHPGKWRLVAASMDDPAATKRQVIERYKKTINPVLRNGAFSRVEDCLLILTIEKLKPFLAREGHFGCLLAYLPWRCETTWRDRANNLFSDWIVPWTLEEDKMLLELADTMNRNWQKISEEFTSFKNRKGCLTRYKILDRRLKEECFNGSLEAYHEAYAMTRYNVFQYKHLKDILKLLTRVQRMPLADEYRQFVGLLRDRPPSEVRLQHMLLCFDRDILDSAIKSLTRYVQTRDNYWESWISKHGKRKRTFDRRTFHPENPQSVASGLHIQGLQLKDKEEIENMNDFESEVYKFYARFQRTKALNRKIKRRYIPDARTLAKWSAVSRLIANSIDSLPDVEVKNKKWKALLKPDENLGTSTSNGIGRARRSYPRNKGRDGAKKKQKNERRGSIKTVYRTNEEGYLLIPETKDIILDHRAGGKRRNPRDQDDVDPEFVAVVSNNMRVEGKANDSVGNGCAPELRRSTRGRKRKHVFDDFQYDDSE